MSNFNFTLSRNSRLLLIGPDGSEVDIQYVANFEPKQDKHDIPVKGLDGNKYVFFAQEGWSCAFQTTRRNAALDQFFAQMESDWRDRGIANTCEVFHYETEADGTQTVYHYTAATLHLADAGKRDVDDKPVEMKIDFWASRRELA